jgi:hypothetical protein
VIEGAPLINHGSSDSESDGESQEGEITEEDEASKERLVYRVGPKGKVKLLTGIDEVGFIHFYPRSYLLIWYSTSRL